MTPSTGDGAPRVVVFGDVIDDVIVTPSGDIRPDTDTAAGIERRAGGSAANFAAWCGRLGLPTHFFGSVSAVDVRHHTDALGAVGVTAHLRGDPVLPTGTIVVILQPDRTRTMLTERGANAATTAEDVDRALLVPGAHLHFTGYSLFSAVGEARVAELQRLIQDAHERGATVSVNPGSAGFIADHGSAPLLEAIRGADLIIPNLDEGRALTGAVEAEAVLDALLELHPVVALTCGRADALLGARGGRPVRVPTIAVTPVDTTGAGDAFSAALVTALLRSAAPDSNPLAPEGLDGDRLAAAGQAAVRAAAEAIQQLGARPRAAAVDGASR